ncbi:MAG: lipopolysaccharide heptosyltransferase I [Rhodocyclaceae bacterium]|nr:lipopolysaccharide heptosyltransferase I [Rhodocyclaceae bacterium]
MRILLVKTSSLGDVIHNLPVASDIRRALPQAEIDWVVEESFAEIPRLHPAVSRVIPVAMRRWRKSLLSPATWQEVGAYRRLASADFYDVVLDTQGLVKSALLAAQARGAKFGHAADSAREPLAARLYDRSFSIPKNLHAVERNRRLAAAALGYIIDDAGGTTPAGDALPLDYGITAPPLKAEWLPTGEYAVLLTATSRADKEWLEEHWLTLGAVLIAAGLRCVLPGGSTAERARAARLAQSLGRAVAAPAMNLTDLAGLMAGARIVIGVDTGLVHLAAALGRPTLALYCASDPVLTGVLGTAPHVNLGGPGTPPGTAAVVSAALKLLGR